MKKVFLTFMMAVTALMAGAQPADNADQVLAVAKKVNQYFMAKYADPTVPTNVGRIRPSSLWTRAVYYEGLMALYEQDPDPRYIDYTDRWANHHQWTPRNGVKTTDADDQCCGQTYLDRYMATKDSKMIEHVRENLDLQMAT
ncbi:MAG: glycoside hydrolase family 88 protein, partial [Prevotella sp.]|nr:glycoside hydrolase family 88 protein [Prevotella sp.]